MARQKSHRDYEPFELPGNMDEDLGMFEAAVHPRHSLPGGVIRGDVLLVQDGSNQDRTAAGLARVVTEKLGGKLRTISNPGTNGPICEAGSAAGLVVVPVPCGEDITGLRSQSLGSVADGLLQECRTPLLCVRDPQGEGEISRFLDRVLVAASRDDDPTWRALSWSIGLASREVLLLEWVDEDTIADAHGLLQGRQESGPVERAVIGRAMTSRLGSLAGAAQRAAMQGRLSLQVEFRLGNPVREILTAAQSASCGLLVMPRTVDRTAPGFHVVADVLLGSRGPVLVI